IKRGQEGSFEVKVTHQKLFEERHFKVEVDSSIEKGYSAKVSDLESGLLTNFTSEDIPERVLDSIYIWIDNYLSIFDDEELKRLSIGIKHYLLLTKKGRLSTNQTLYIENMGSCLRALRSLFTNSRLVTWQEKRESISLLLTFIRLKGRQTEQAIVQSIFSDEINRIANKIGVEGLSIELGSYLLAIIEVAQEHKIGATLTVAQEVIYPILREGQFKTPIITRLLEELRGELNIAPCQ
ncbi:MAG: hypothetical protein GX842_06505, partial [Spirochaetales bacterium]|nr:hypothetical protein [Spirochaetales bacterium]